MSEWGAECAEKDHEESKEYFCTKCKQSLGKQCLLEEHFEHVGLVEHCSTKALELANMLICIRAKLGTILTSSMSIVQQLDCKQAWEQQQEGIETEFTGFQEWLQTIKQKVCSRVKASRYLRELGSTISNERKEISDQLLAARDWCKAKLDRLLSVEKEASYLQHMELIMQDDLPQTKDEINSYVDTLQEKNRILESNIAQWFTIAYQPDPTTLQDLCHIDIIPLMEEKLVLVRKNARELWIYYPDIGISKSVILESTFTSPMNFGLVEIKDKGLYIIGGNYTPVEGKTICTRDMNKIKLENYKVKSKPSLQERRRRAGVVAIKNQTIFALGGDNEDRYLDSCEVFDIQKKEWQWSLPLSEPKTNVGAGSFDNRYLYVFGGFNQQQRDVLTIERLNLTKLHKWAIVPIRSSLHWLPTQNVGVLQISSSEILVWGGMRTGRMLSSSAVYRVKDKTFEENYLMQDCDTFMQVTPKLCDDYMYSFSCHKCDLHIFNITTRHWTLLPNSRWYHPHK